MWGIKFVHVDDENKFAKHKLSQSPNDSEWSIFCQFFCGMQSDSEQHLDYNPSIWLKESRTTSEYRKLYETRIRLLLLYIKNSDDSFLGWMLSKIRIIPKKASNKSFSTSNFEQKSLWEHMSISPWSGARELERWYGLNMKLYRSGKIHSLLGWMLPKIRIIPKKASSKSFSALNFEPKSLHGHMYISHWIGARGLER